MANTPATTSARLNRIGYGPPVFTRYENTVSPEL